MQNDRLIIVYIIIIMVINITICHNIMAETTGCKINDECYAYAYNDDYSCFYMEYTRAITINGCLKQEGDWSQRGRYYNCHFTFWIFRWNSKYKQWEQIQQQGTSWLSTSPQQAIDFYNFIKSHGIQKGEFPSDYWPDGPPGGCLNTIDRTLSLGNTHCSTN